MSSSADPAFVVSQNAHAAGYAHADYAASFSELGSVQELPASGGWILRRSIGGAARTDAMGCYPFFSCLNWRSLEFDLSRELNDLVCLSIVTDPFAAISEEELRSLFPDRCVRFKEHFVCDLTLSMREHVAAHHQRNSLRAGRHLEVLIQDQPAAWLPDWQRLYQGLIQRHGIQGMAQFSAEVFARQLRVPGIRACAALRGERIVGMALFYVQGDVAYYHLGAYDDIGYELGASFAIFSSAWQHFAQAGLRWMALGAGAGTTECESGLTRFKRGWATGTRPVYFCGRILRPDLYRELSASTGMPVEYFPSYRAGEF